MSIPDDLPTRIVNAVMRQIEDDRALNRNNCEMAIKKELAVKEASANSAADLERITEQVKILMREMAYAGGIRINGKDGWPDNMRQAYYALQKITGYHP